MKSRNLKLKSKTCRDVDVNLNRYIVYSQIKDNSTYREIRIKNKGITLISLLITIIVMLILVAVTVVVSLNGGLFTFARQTANKTNVEIDKEIFQLGVVGALNEELKIVNVDSLKSNLPDKWIVTGADGGPYTATSPNGNIFIVNESGNIKDEKAELEELQLLEKYVLGDDRTGKNLDEIWDSTTNKFKDDKVTLEDESTVLIFLNKIVDPTNEYIYIKYNDKAYKITYDSSKITKSIELIYEPKGKEGEIVKYDSNDDGTEEEWMILYDNKDNIEIVSMEVMGALVLGDANLEKAIYSYDNVIEILNEYCESLVTNENKISVRSVGSNPTNPSSENTTLYKSDNLENWNPAYNGVGKSTDTNYQEDLVRMSYYNAASNTKAYYLASRKAGDGSNVVSFNVRGGYNNGLCGSWQLWTIDVNGRACGIYNGHGVRPVVKLNATDI